MTPSTSSTSVLLPIRSSRANALFGGALRAALLRLWNAACRHAERRDRVVPYC